MSTVKTQIPESLPDVDSLKRIILQQAMCIALFEEYNLLEKIRFFASSSEKSVDHPGLLANVSVAKYQDASPLYRLENILGRAGVDIPRNNLIQLDG